MDDIFSDAVHLRELATKCRRIAETLTDENDVASLRQMAAEYEAMANGNEIMLIPNQHHH